MCDLCSGHLWCWISCPYIVKALGFQPSSQLLLWLLQSNVIFLSCSLLLSLRLYISKWNLELLFQFSWLLFCLYPIDSIFQNVLCCPVCMTVSHLSLMVMVIVWIWEVQSGVGETEAGICPLIVYPKGQRCPLPSFLTGSGLDSGLERTKSDYRCDFFFLTDTRLSACLPFFYVFMGTCTVHWGLCSCHLHTRFHVLLGSSS